MTGKNLTKRKKSAMLSVAEHEIKHQALQQAINIAGSQQKLSHLIGASTSQIQNWFNRKDSIPFDAAFLMMIFTHVPLEQLAPYSPYACYLLTQSFNKILSPLTIVKIDTVTSVADFSAVDDAKNANLYRPIIIDHQNRLIYGYAQLSTVKKHHKRKQIPAIQINCNQPKSASESTILHPQGWINSELQALEHYFEYLFRANTIATIPQIRLDDDGFYIHIASSR